MNGSTKWVITGGHIPLFSTGPEPANTSRDELHFLNTSTQEARITLMVYYTDRNPVGPFHLSVDARRLRIVRCNDLIDPEAIPLATDYALLIESDRPLTVQMIRIDSSSGSVVTTPIPATAFT